ncbi:MAG TPA: hypothetical protein VID25_02445 [Candidatus Limnocylindrales bacterium]
MIEGIATTVTVRVTSGSQSIGCVALSVPAGFTVLATNVVSVPAGFIWTSSGAGVGPTLVTVSTTKDSWRIKNGAQAVFSVQVLATTSPAPAWVANAYQKFSVDSKEIATGPLLRPGPFIIVPAPTPTPTPRPTPSPPPTATPSPTPLPGSTPTPGPAMTVAPSGTSPAASGSLLPGVTVAPSPSGSAPPSSSSVPVAGTGLTLGQGNAGGGSSSGSGAALGVPSLPAGGTIHLDDLQGMGVVGMFAWLVPGLLLSLPGLLILIVLIAQVGFATAFIPVTRRVLGSRRGTAGPPDRGQSPG